ncbi:TPR-like protein [Xylariaceae sp. AK1471]|nr:TPR-like protein [Xylariaceae sp. AK1471]
MFTLNRKETKQSLLCCVGYGLAGIIIQKTLYDLTQQSVYSEIIRRIRGLIFLATPCLKSIPALQLSWIIRHQKHRNTKVADLPSLATYCKKFTRTELARRCPILLCYETIKVSVKAKSPFWSHKVQLVDKDLIATFPTNDKAELVGIDCDIRSIFSRMDCAIHDRILEFLSGILQHDHQGGTPSSQWPDGWVEIQNSAQIPSTPANGEIVSSQGHRPSAIPIQSLPEPAAIFQQPLDQSSLLSPGSSISQNTTRATSLSSSDNSYIFVASHKDIKIRTPTVFIQHAFYERPNSDFQGRDDIISNMSSILSPLSSPMTHFPRTCVLHGPGGMGKTQTALHYFHTKKDEFDVALWLQANNAESLLTGYYQAAVELGLHTAKDTSQQTDHNTKQILDWLRNPNKEPSNPRSRRLKWLIVFDNVPVEKVMANFWPRDADGSIIVTTRDPMISEIFASPNGNMTVSPLSQTDCVALLRRKLPARLLHQTDDGTLIQVVRALAYWPLVIVQIAGNMQRLGQTPTRFLKIYQNQTSRYNYYDEVERVQDGYMTPLSLLWSLKTLKPTAARLLSILSLLLPDSVPEFILEEASGEAQLEGYPTFGEYDFAISELERESIVTRVLSLTGKGREISVHSVIQEVIRSQLLHEEHSFMEIFNSTVRVVMAFWDYQSIPMTKYRELALADKKRWERCDVLLPHMGNLRAMFELLSEDGKRACATEKFFYMMNEAGWHHVLQRSLDEALDWANATLRYFELCPDDYPELRACQYATLSAVARVQNNPDIACETYERCFRINEEVYQRTKIITSQLVAAYTELGRVLIMAGNLERASYLIKQSIKLRKKMANFSRLQLYSPIIFNSYIQLLKGDYDEAERELLGALKDREEAYKTKDDTKSKRSGHLLYMLGTVVSKVGRYEQACQYYQRSLSVFQQTGGEQDTDYAQSCYKIAACHLRGGALDLARSMIDQAIDVFSHRKYYEAYYSRALYLKSKTLTQAGDHQEAQQVFKDSIGVRIQVAPTESKSPALLQEEDFDGLIAIWNR